MSGSEPAQKYFGDAPHPVHLALVVVRRLAIEVLLVVMVALVVFRIASSTWVPTPLLTTTAAGDVESTVPPLMETGRPTRTWFRAFRFRQPVPAGTCGAGRRVHRGSAGLRGAPGAAVGDAEHLPGEEGWQRRCPAPATSGSEEDTVRWTPHTPVVSQADLSRSRSRSHCSERVVPETFEPGFVPAVAPEAVPPDVHAADLADTGLPAAAVCS